MGPFICTYAHKHRFRQTISRSTWSLMVINVRTLERLSFPLFSPLTKTQRFSPLTWTQVGLLGPVLTASNLGLCPQTIESCWIGFVKTPHCWDLTQFFISHPGNSSCPGQPSAKILASWLSQNPLLLTFRSWAWFPSPTTKDPCNHLP